MSYLDEDEAFKNRLWQKRRRIFLVFSCFTLYWILILTIPYFALAGSDNATSFAKLGFVLPLFGIVFTASSLTKISPIYKTSKSDVPVIILFALLVFLFPLFVNLHEIQNIEIADAIWTVAWISSLGLAILSGIIGFKQIRKHYILLGAPIILGLLATSIGGLSGAIFFKTLSYLIGFN